MDTACTRASIAEKCSSSDWLKRLPVTRAYLDGELCAVRPDGTTSFSLMQAATEREGERIVYFAFDLLHLDGDDLLPKPLLARKERLAEVLKGAPRPMKMGTIASPWRYDATAAETIRPDNQRRTTILRYASWAAVFPISLAVRLPFDSGPFRPVAGST